MHSRHFQRFLPLLAFLLCFVAAVSAQQPLPDQGPAPVDVTGKWTI